jgi:hypothetical protein
MPHDTHRLSLSQVNEVAELGFGLIGGKSLHRGQFSTNRTKRVIRTAGK